MQHFRIRRNFLLALGLTGLLLIVLLLLCIIQKEATGKTLILAAIMLPVLGLFAESWRRQISFSADQIIARRLFRTKVIPLADITSVDTVRVRRRVFVSISTEADFLILSNNYEKFGQLVTQLLERLPDTVISDETRELADNLPNKSNDLFSIWLAVIVLILILYIQLGGRF
ncbi:hypothetical protein [Geopsychrobacter electrodiphilus]|uniref:hypothetical protein n=1 Tax=Geopsychrobacter electrodiphilus TaxID=225196 RepID=UPI00037F57DD|nr:hypothetical protein [Geopsychrobacter electrodiphilus]